MRITQKEIARRLGVSLITVSRALGGTGYVSENMKRRIVEYAREHNYIPHKASQVLVRNRIQRLALFSSTLPSYFWDDIRKGIEVAASQIRPFDYEVRYLQVPEADTETYLAMLRGEIEAGVRAVGIVHQPIYDMDAVYSTLDGAGIPYVTFNVDAPERRGLCYIGADYYAGGRLAAEVIGTALRAEPGASVLVIGSDTTAHRDRFDLNADRLDGFLGVMRERFPSVRCDVQCVDAEQRPHLTGDQIEGILREKRGTVRAVYLIPAVNTIFLDLLERIGYRDTINLVHDLDSSAMRCLETHLLTACIHQNPILQGYYTVKTLEHIVESGLREPMEGVEIVSNVVFSENRDISRNHFALIR